MLRRSWVEISTETVLTNYRTYRAALPASMEVMAVVKANAYGHGDRELAPMLQRAGCGHFAVSNLEEAVTLRESGITGQILILGYTPASEAAALREYRITQALLNEEHAASFTGTGILAHCAVDTGMNRIGLDASDPAACEKAVREAAGKVELTGLFTHLCVADTADGRDFTLHQLATFRAVAERVRDLRLPWVHCMNSAGGLRYPAYGTLCRLGIILYGLKPDVSNELPEGIMPAMTWKSVVSMVKAVHPGETIGYGRTFTAEREMRVATIPTGYADGYSRALSNRGSVVIRGRRAPIVGRICMDQFMVDVSELPEVRAEDEVILMGPGYTAEDMAGDAGTISYEVVCGISDRVTKLWK